MKQQTNKDRNKYLQLSIVNKILFYVCHSLKTRRQTISHVLYFLVFSQVNHYSPSVTNYGRTFPLSIGLGSTSLPSLPSHPIVSISEESYRLYRNLCINLLSPILKLLFFGSMPSYFFPEKLLPSHKDLSLKRKSYVVFFWGNLCALFLCFEVNLL